MTDEAQHKPWEVYGTQDGSEQPPVAQEKAPAQAAPPEDYAPWKVYGRHEFVDPQEKYEGDVADAVATSLQERAEAQAANMTGLEKTADWFGDVAKGTFFGPVANPIAALILSKKFEEHGVTYADAMAVIKANDAATKNTTADITGAILGGGLLVRGGQKLVAEGAKRGFARGALQYLSRDTKTAKVLSSIAAGAAAGSVEEGMRVGLEETFDATAGMGFEGDRVKDSALMGALIGGAAGPVADAAMAGGGRAWQFARRMFGSDDANAMKATQQLLKEYANSNETLEEAGMRFQQSVRTFQEQNGRLPAAAEIMKPEQVRNMADVVRLHNGLDTRARELGEEGVERALKEYNTAVTMGNQVASPELIESHMEDLFTDVMTRHGNKMVPVGDETFALMQQNRDWIRQVGMSGNQGAARMSEILDTQANIQGMRNKVRQLLDRNNTAAERDMVAELREELAFELDRLFKEAGADSSKVAELQNMIQLNKAITDKLATGRHATHAGFQLDEFRPMLQNMEGMLKDFEENGLMISLSDANQIRSTASKHFNMARRSGDAPRMDAARRVRDAVGPVGKVEVPEYGQVVKAWNLEMNRVEAMETGIKAARGDMIVDDLAVRLEKGRIPGKPRQGSPEQLEAIQKGAGEGSRLELSQQIERGTRAGVGSAQRVASSPRAQKSLALTLGDLPAKEITRHAKKVSDTYERMAALAQPRSAGTLQQEMDQARDIATGAVFGNLGGAGKAALLTRLFRDLKMPRGTAEKVVDMLGDPSKIDQALRYMQSKNIRVGPLFAAINAHLTEPVPNEE